MKNTIKKITATLMAATTLTVGMAGMNANASGIELNESNCFSVTTNTVTDVVVGNDGTIIPIGSTAVTVSLSGNTGFDSTTTTLDIGTANVIVDNEGNPVYNVGTVLESSLIASATNDNIVAFSSASANDVCCNGELFTFYISSGLDEIEIIDEEMETSASIGNFISPTATLYSYMIGDVDQSNKVTASDASTILYAISLYEQEFNNTILTVGYANYRLNHYFPDALRAESADGDASNTITAYDASLVLTYYTNAAAGNTTPVEHVGEIVYYIE